jgi:hypothetical protein
MVHVLAKALGVSAAYLLGEAVADQSAAYQADPRTAILADYDAPPGLRGLAEDAQLVKVLRMAPHEWSALRSLVVPSPPSKDGYLALLHVIRAICPVC